MKSLLLLTLCACLVVAQNQQCYRLGTVPESCDSDAVELKVVTGPPGKPGAKGRDGEPCATSQKQFDDLKKLASDLSKNINGRSDELMKKIKNINETIKQTTKPSSTSGQGTQVVGGGHFSSLHGTVVDPTLQLLTNTYEVHGRVDALMLGYVERQRGGIPLGVVMQNGVVRYDLVFHKAFHGLARKICAEKGGILAYRGLETLEKRKHLIGQLFGPDHALMQRIPNQIIIGMQKRGGVWHYDNGERVNMATFGAIDGKDDCAVLYAPRMYANTLHSRARSQPCKFIGSFSPLGEESVPLCHYPYRIPFHPPGKQTPFKTSLNFQQAREFCHKKGGRIALESIKTHNKLRQLVQGGKVAVGEYWIGVRKVIGTAWTYHYIDLNEAIDRNTFPWLPNQPTFVRAIEQCAVLSVKKGAVGIINKPCASSFNVLCEYSS